MIQLGSENARKFGNNNESAALIFNDANVARVRVQIQNNVQKRSQIEIPDLEIEDLKSVMVKFYNPQLNIEAQNEILVREITEIVLNNLVNYAFYLSDTTRRNENRMEFTNPLNARL